MSLRRLLRALPKVELHCHLLGTIRQATFHDLVRRSRASITAETIDGWYLRGDKPVGVLHILRALDAQVLRTPDDLHRLMVEYLEDAAAHGVRWAEVAWNPTGTARLSGIPYPRAVEALVRAIADARRDHGIEGRIIAAIDREAGTDAAVEMVEQVIAHPCDEVLGIGIDYRETEHPPELFWKAYRLARRAGLRTTAHAGEFGTPWTNVETAVDLLGVERVDHGYTIVCNPELARRCAEMGIVFTVVPTNSHYLRTLPPERWAQDHPIRAMPGLGLSIHPNTDDPTLHGVTPTDAWAMMVERFGFGLDDVARFMLAGLDGAWIDDTTRRAWTTAWTTELAALRDAHDRVGGDPTETA